MALRQRPSKQKVNRNSNSANSSPVPDSNLREKDENNGHVFGSTVTWRKVALRCLSSLLIIFVVYWSSKKEEKNIFAKREENLQLKSQEVPCSSQTNKNKQFEGCVSERCGRFVSDIIIMPHEVNQLLQLSKKGFSLGSSSGGATILDLHSGALSHKDAFVNIYQKMKSEGKRDLFTVEDFKIYTNVRKKIQNVIAFNFGIQSDKLYLTHPTFFSKMTAKPPRTIHDEYWHTHIDKETYPSFYYTSLLYLSDYGTDFTGGRFEFVDKKGNITIEPKMGRVSVFTSGAENPHYVERVKSGIRYALTVSFTCDREYAISDPSMKKTA